MSLLGLGPGLDGMLLLQADSDLSVVGVVVAGRLWIRICLVKLTDLSAV